MPPNAREEIFNDMRRYRAQVLLRWRQRIADEIPCSAILPEPVVFDTMPELYDYLTQSVADPEELGRTALARAHGADRARQAGYRPADLLREFQILRRCMAEIAEEEEVALTPRHIMVLAASFDTVEREALDEYDIVQRRERETAREALTVLLREDLNVIGMASQRIIASGNLVRIAELANRIRVRVNKLEQALDEHDRDAAPQAERLPLLLSTFDVMDLVREVCTDAAQCDTTVQGEPVIVTWCRMSVRQALRNLLAERRDAEGSVSVSVRQANGRAAVSVLHRHVLPPDVVRNLFIGRGRKSHPTVREWGTGLEFVREVAETHGGSAIVNSSQAMGTEFRLDLPVDASPFLRTWS